jgi:hypothetical protein
VSSPVVKSRNVLKRNSMRFAAALLGAHSVSSSKATITTLMTQGPKAPFTDPGT